jgi:three-Cys-motif partner protein
MPLDGSAGYGEGTPRKRHDFKDYQRLHLQVARAVMNRSDWAGDIYHYVELYAGPGRPGGEEGTPLIFVENALEEGGEWNAYFCEIDPESVQRLGTELSTYGRVAFERSAVYPRDHREAVIEIASHIQARSPGKRAFGLIFADPNGTRLDEEIESIQTLSEAHPRMDILLYLSATSIKRSRSLFGSSSLLERLAAIGKQRMLIREPHTEQQWTFVLLTNWGQYPDWRRRSFHDSNSKAGARILEKLELTPKERQEKNQMTLDISE